MPFYSAGLYPEFEIQMLRYFTPPTSSELFFFRRRRRVPSTRKPTSAPAYAGLVSQPAAKSRSILCKSNQKHFNSNRRWWGDHEMAGVLTINFHKF